MEPFIGQIMLVPYSFAPRGYADCAGQSLSIAQNTALFSLLGTTFGGDGRTTFALPDLRGRAAVGMGTGPGRSAYPLGQAVGSEAVTLTTGTMPSHSHALMANTGTGTGSLAAGMTFAHTVAPRGGVGPYSAGPSDTSLGAATVQQNQGGTAHDNRQPSLTLRYIIAIQGIFPTRQ